MEKLIQLIKEKEVNIENLLKQYTALTAKKYKLIDDGEELNESYLENQEKIIDYTTKLKNLINFEHNKKYIKICAIAHHIFLTLILTAFICMHVSNLYPFAFFIILGINNLISGSIMYAFNKISVRSLKKKIDPNYTANDLTRIIKTLKANQKELEHQRESNNLTKKHLENKIKEILSVVNKEQCNLRVLKNKQNNLVNPVVIEKDEINKTKKLKK